MSLKVVVLIFFCLLSLALASEKEEENSYKFSDFGNPYEEWFKSIPETIPDESLDLDKTSDEPVISDEFSVDSGSSKLLASPANRRLHKPLDLGGQSEPDVKEVPYGFLDLVYRSLTAKGVAPTVTIEKSNLPHLIQLAAADCLKLAYKFHETDADRIILFTALFTQIAPAYYQWNVVLNYQYVNYFADYYIKLRTDDGDVVFVFSSDY